ncbi:MAG: hypothetical protein SFX73_26230 [Kofleriaceae bacterium]|nr:hypothetical protein [Kofleriaceae bacterium]
MRSFLRTSLILALVASCGGDDADALGVGAQCTSSDDCDDGSTQMCLPFKGGYCGLTGCAHDTDCPADAACIAHDDGVNYCFRTCATKADCNANRDAENEANCSSTAVFVDGDAGRKACTPPSGS